MDQKLSEIIAEYLPAAFLVGGYAMVKYAAPAIKWIKDTFFNNKKESKPESSIHINVEQGASQSIPQYQFDASKADWGQIITILLQHAKLISAIGNLKGDILGEQMEYFRKMTRPIKIRCTEIICELLNDAGIENIYFGTYFINAENFIEICGNHMEATFRQMCKANHFTEKTNAGFREVIETNIFIIDGLLNELLMKRYPQRQMLKDMKNFDCLRAELRDALRECFQHARDIAIEKETEVENDIEQFSDYMFKLTGNRYNLSI